MTNPPRSRRSTSRWIIASSLVLLAMAGLGTPSASASHCGGSLLSGSMLREDLARLLGAVDSDRPEPLPVPSVPKCNGPSCSGQPARPMPAPVLSTVPVDDRALPGGLVAIVASRSIPLVADESEARPIRQGSAVFHPPRPGASA